MTERRELRPASSEILDEFERVRERFLTEFDPVTDLALPTINAYFDERGLYRHPGIMVPYNQEGFSTARAIATESKYPIPFILKTFPRNRDFSRIYDAPMGFSLASYRLNCLIDASNCEPEVGGKEYAERVASTIVAHEDAHSVFDMNPTILMGDQGTIYEQYRLSGNMHRVYDQKKRHYIMPVWVEEAFAVYVSATALKNTIPEQKGQFQEFAPFGDDEYWLDGHYLVYTPEWSENPGSINGAIAGQTLENLELRVPGTIDHMFGVAKGTVNPEEFRANLRRKVGNKLFGMMFKRHPYTSWTTINNMVIDLE